MSDRDPDSLRISLLLRAWSEGDAGARDELIPIVYPKLKSLAARYMSGERSGHTLSATALVNEAYLKLAGSDLTWDSRVHFFAVAARVMRHLLVDHAKAKHSGKRGGGAAKLSLDEAAVISAAPETDLIALDVALSKLASVDERRANLVELVYFGGLQIGEAGAVIGVSEQTVYRELRLAKAWLYSVMAGELNV
jgi:RNA polymerase sigma factor (TIGR02999 family)